MKTNQCDRQRIDAFFRDDASGTDMEWTQHLETCEACRQYFDSQAAQTQLWAEARRMLRPTEFDVACTAEFSAGGQGDRAACQPPSIQSVLDLLAPSDDPHRLGRLAGYEISGVVGVGGMGVVLKAVDPSLDRVVAIKVMAPHLANNATARKRFSREAKAAAAVLHPNVIPIHCVSSDDAVPYLVMAYIRGGSLQKRLEQEGPLPTVEVLRIGSQIAAGLAAAHEQGLVHRDIKPENILLEEGVERVTLTDFGLARAVDDASVTREGTIAGTPQYMSPEQARGESVDQKSDLFSLGSVLYALCTGRPPFRADSSYGVMRRISDETPVPIRELNPDIPEWLCALIAKLMAKNKEDRLESASEIHRLLEACLSHVQQPTAAPLPLQLLTKSRCDEEHPCHEKCSAATMSPEQHIQRHRNRSRWLLLSAVAALFVAAIAPALVYVLSPPEGPFMVGGGGAVAGEGWYFTSGSIYLQEGEPGVLFGMHEDPAGNRKVSYVVLFHHNVVDSTEVSRPKNAGLKFDGNVASITDGIAIDERAIQLALRIRLNKDRSAIESTKLTIDGKDIDYANGGLLLVDLTSDSVTYTQVNARFPNDLPNPRDIVKDTEAVSTLAPQLAQLDGVRQISAVLGEDGKWKREKRGAVPGASVSFQSLTDVASGVAFSADSSRLAETTQRGIRIWSVEGTLLKEFATEVLGHGYSRKGDFIYFDGQRIDQAGKDDVQEFARAVGHELTLCHDVDAASFRALSEEYTKDKNKVYYKWISPGRFWVVELPGADAKSFDVVGFNLAKDNRSVWWYGRVLPEVDAATVELVKDGFVWKDASHVWYQHEKFADADPKTFRHLAQAFYVDADRVYWSNAPLDGADPQTFRTFGDDSPYGADRNRVWMATKTITGVDAETFEAVHQSVYKDKRGVYASGNPITDADPRTFRKIADLDEHFTALLADALNYYIFLPFRGEVFRLEPTTDSLKVSRQIWPPASTKPQPHAPVPLATSTAELTEAGWTNQEVVPDVENQEAHLLNIYLPQFRKAWDIAADRPLGPPDAMEADFVKNPGQKSAYRLVFAKEGAAVPLILKVLDRLSGEAHAELRSNIIEGALSDPKLCRTEAFREIINRGASDPAAAVRAKTAEMFRRSRLGTPGDGENANE